MKSLFSRLRGQPTPPPTRPSSSASGGKENANGPNGSRKRPVSLRQTSDTPSNTSAPLRSPTPLSNTDRPGSSRPQSTDIHVQTHAQDMDALGAVWESEESRMRRASGEGGKKVTFRSPNPTPAPSTSLLDPPAPISRSPDKMNSRLVDERPNPPSRASTAQSYSSRRSLSMRKTSTPYGQPFAPSPNKSPLLSPTGSDGSQSTRSYLPPPNSWSEMAEEELIANLGPRERTRQEVLWEIVSSEERYVSELHKLVETFCKALLPASAQSPSLGLYNPSENLARTLSPTSHSPMQTPTSPAESDESHLPIAAKYASSSSRHTGLSGATRSASGSTTATSPTESKSPTDARLNAYNILTNGRPSHKVSQASMNQGRSHHSLPPPPRNGQNQTQTSSFSASYARMSHQSGKQAKDRRSSTQSITKSIALPEELEAVLKVLAGGILEGHIKLAAALKKRYDNQYPLVRSLADVFTAHSYILREYATYVLHLERALTIVDESLALLPPNTTSNTTKRQSKRIDESPSLRLSYFLHSLEDLATERGESGLVISLSKPFQRLLKYPLLFQNLLFNTDPSLKEYEATLAMVDEVEVIVRTIEDEKASSEEREKTRDVWARIEGLEKDKMLMAPKPNRLLSSETQLPPTESNGRNDTAQRKSFKRLSDILSRTDHHDLWVVRFTDVALLCEKTGSTNLPIHRTKTQATRSESLTDIGKREKPVTKGRRGMSIRARNLYKFIKVHEWHLNHKNGSSEGLLDMREISESRRLNEAGRTTPPQEGRLPTIQNSPMTTPRKSTAQRLANASSTSDDPMNDKTPTKVPLKTVDGPSPMSTKSLRRRETDTDTLVSDRQSVMSFAFKGADQRPVQRRVRAANPTAATASKSSAPTRAGSGPGQRMTVTAANAKFAHRLRSPDLVHDEHGHPVHGHGHGQEEDPHATIRPQSSKTRRSLPPAMALQPSTHLPEQSLHNGHLLNPPRIVSIASTYSRGINGSTPPVVAGRSISAATAKRLSLKAEQARTETPPTASVSGDSGLAMWKAYGAAQSTEGTPRRVMAGRQLGGRI